MGDSYSLMYLPLLTQLRELALTPCDDGGDFYIALGNPPRAPLAAMTGLVSLKLTSAFGLAHDKHVDEAELPLLLPPNLEQLHVEFWHDTPSDFWRHIAGCSNLISIHLQTSPCDEYCATDHPSWMLYTIAGSLGRLQHLHLQGSPCWEESPGDLHELLSELAETEAAQQQEEQHGWDWMEDPVSVLGPGDLSQQARPCDNYIMLPPPNMGGLSALQSL
jgi:hypothetical protein